MHDRTTKRVVLLNNNKIEDFDHETSHRKQLKGNVYLARVTRVVHPCRLPLLNMVVTVRFLAFSEIPLITIAFPLIAKNCSRKKNARRVKTVMIHPPAMTAMMKTAMKPRKMVMTTMAR